MRETGQSVTKHLLANRVGIRIVCALLAGLGAICPKCGYGTRATSKRWAKCKRCGERVSRATARAARNGQTH